MSRRSSIEPTTSLSRITGYSADSMEHRERWLKRYQSFFSDGILDLWNVLVALSGWTDERAVRRSGL